MGKIDFNYRSEILGYYVDVTVVYPTDALTIGKNPSRFPYRDGVKFQTIYLLHGGGDDDSLVFRYTNAELYAQRNCVMLVAPSLPNSFFVDTSFGIDYGRFLAEELPMVAQSLFASAPGRENTFLMGYAMGGSGALAAAIRHPELYSHCIDISGGVSMGLELERFRTILKTKDSPLAIYLNSFGKPEDLDGSSHDLSRLITDHLAAGDAMPALTMAVGSEEAFVRDTMLREAEVLRGLGWPPNVIELPGYTHDFPLWDECLKRAMYEWLPLKRAPIYAE